ncbi:MAG: response regulator [Clostridia bacterium]|nr:response regulator [Clostridia bacterium]
MELKVIVADDEKWVRAAIVNTIPFERLGLTLVSEASNGIEALALCKQHQPDILLTDIMMPGFNGIELIEQLKEFLPEIKIIIISGYSDFEYAKKALKHGVSEYVLKPVDEAEITKALSNIKNALLNERKRREEEEFFKSAYRKHALPSAYEKFLNEIIIENTLTLENIKSKLHSFQIRFDSQYFSVFCFSPYTPASLNNSQSSYYKKITRRVMQRYLKGITFPKTGTSTELITIVNHPMPELPQNYNKILSLCQRIYEKRFRDKISVGISTSSRQLTKLPILYKQALDALSRRFWDPEDQIFYFPAFHQGQEIRFSLNESDLNGILLGIKVSNCNPAFDYLDSLYSSFTEKKCYNPDEIKEFFWLFILNLLNHLNLNLSFIELEKANNKGVHPYDALRSITTLNSLLSNTKDMIQRISMHYLDKNPIENEDIIGTAKKIIDENYFSDISLDFIANHLHFNAAYFSEYFKKETGMSFIDYKTSVRIENAKKLLCTTALNVNEISSKVGFNDPKYFSKLFKKITGMTLQDYRKSQEG